MSTMATAKTKTKTPPPLPALVGVAELAALFGASPQLAHKWTLSKRFPAAAYGLAAGRLWLRDDVIFWSIEHRPDLAKGLDPKLVRRVKRQRSALKSK